MKLDKRLFYLVGWSVTSCVHFLCGATALKCAACCTISPASSNPKPYLKQERNMHCIIYCMCLCICEGQASLYPYILTHMWPGGFYVGGWMCCRSRVSANGSDMRRQQVIDEDDVVLWPNRCPLRPGWGWGLLFVPAVIAWRIDSEQCAISRTVIKAHYSFFTTPIWVLETQWSTLKRCCCLVTVWPLPILLSLLHFTASASPSLYVPFESSALIFPLCPLFFTEQPAIQCSFPL